MSSKILISLIFALVAILIFVLSYNSIWIIDCITYKYNFDTGEKIRNLGDIFESQYVHYFTWNGRYVAHWLCQLFLSLLGKGVFSAVNGLMYIALIVLILKLVSNDLITVSRVLTAACLVLIFCETEYIPPCQIGYIWMAILVLVYLLLFFNYAKFGRKSFLVHLTLFLFSLVAGNGQEAINIGVGGALIVFTLLNIKRMTAAQWYMLVGFGIGALFLCLSPATVGRVDEMKTTPIYSILNFFLNLRVTYILIIILFYNLLRHRITLRNFYQENAFYINAIIVLLIFNFLIGVGGNRQLFGIEMFSSIITIKILKRQSFSTIFLAILSLVVISIYILKYQEIKKSETVYKEVSEKISTNNGSPIFIDYPNFNSFLHSTTVFRYGVYLDYALRTIRAEHTGDIQDKSLISCYPTKVEEILTQPVRNQFYEYLPGEFVLMQSKDQPKQFILHRTINFLGVNIPLASYQVNFDPDSHLNTEDYYILYLPSLMPMIKNQSITIK